MNNSIKQKLSELIILGRTKDAILFIKDNLESFNADLVSDLHVLGSQFNSNENMFNLGLLHTEEYLTHKNRINKTIVDVFIDNKKTKKNKSLELININEAKVKDLDSLELTIRNNEERKVHLESLILKASQPIKIHEDRNVKNDTSSIATNVGGMIGLIAGTIIAAPFIIVISPLLPIAAPIITLTLPAVGIIGGGGILGAALGAGIFSQGKSLIIEGESTSSLDNITRKVTCIVSQKDEKIYYELLLPCNFIVEEAETFATHIVTSKKESNNKPEYKIADEFYTISEFSECTLFTNLGCFTFTQKEIPSLEKLSRLL